MSKRTQSSKKKKTAKTEPKAKSKPLPKAEQKTAPKPKPSKPETVLEVVEGVVPETVSAPKKALTREERVLAAMTSEEPTVSSSMVEKEIDLGFYKPSSINQQDITQKIRESEELRGVNERKIAKGTAGDIKDKFETSVMEMEMDAAMKKYYEERDKKILEEKKSLRKRREEQVKRILGEL